MSHWFRRLHLQQAVLMLVVSNGCLLIGVNGGILPNELVHLNTPSIFGQISPREQEWFRLRLSQRPDAMSQSMSIPRRNERDRFRRELAPPEEPTQEPPQEPDDPVTQKIVPGDSPFLEPLFPNLQLRQIPTGDTSDAPNRRQLFVPQRPDAMSQSMSIPRRNERDRFGRELPPPEKTSQKPGDPVTQEILSADWPYLQPMFPPKHIRQIPTGDSSDAPNRRQLFVPENGGIIDNPGTHPPLKKWLKESLPDQEYHDQVGVISGGQFSAGSSRQFNGEDSIRGTDGERH
ncbi:uncharacterized protein LOC124405152 [Diprion similis]|uniref:uncharacterized protein LOC124405152 n=1 Tax=Diprion similis TaxID=362088 RepID=UPI001EF91BE0|nr:uncharacterized protein LOC124405152 [Diprion similis]